MNLNLLPESCCTGQDSHTAEKQDKCGGFRDWNSVNRDPVGKVRISKRGHPPKVVIVGNETITIRSIETSPSRSVLAYERHLKGTLFELHPKESPLWCDPIPYFGRFIKYSGPIGIEWCQLQDQVVQHLDKAVTVRTCNLVFVFEGSVSLVRYFPTQLKSAVVPVPAGSDASSFARRSSTRKVLSANQNCVSMNWRQAQINECDGDEKGV